MNNSKIEKRIQDEIDKLLDLTNSYESEEISIRDMEKGIFSQLLKIGLALLQRLIRVKMQMLLHYRPKIEGGEYLESKGMKSRKYLSIFGNIAILRPRHWHKTTGSYYELDERLTLPKSSTWSYNLQEWIGENSAENDYRESVRMLNKILGLKMSGKSSQRNAERLGRVVETYYESKEKEIENTATVCFSASFDGKGVPKITKKKEPKGNPKERLKRGEKNGTKQMATVSVTSSFTPKIRTKDSILRGLMGIPLSKTGNIEQEKKERQKNDNRWHKKIHRRAYLNNQAKSIRYGLDDIRLRMKNPQSRFIVPIDAGAGLENKILSYVKEHKLENQFDGIIIDIIHVSEYVWDCATAIFGEKSNIRTRWVRKVLDDLLENKTDKVIKDIKLIRDRIKMTANKKKQLDKAITYFINHKHNMDYKTFIQKGYPVSSALVESACGHLVKERMEQSGMRWSSKGAQNILDLRAVKINDDIVDFMDYFIKYERTFLSKIAA